VPDTDTEFVLSDSDSESSESSLRDTDLSTRRAKSHDDRSGSVVSNCPNSRSTVSVDRSEASSPSLLHSFLNVFMSRSGSGDADEAPHVASRVGASGSRRVEERHTKGSQIFPEAVDSDCFASTTATVTTTTTASTTPPHSPFTQSFENGSTANSDHTHAHAHHSHTHHHKHIHYIHHSEECKQVEQGHSVIDSVLVALHLHPPPPASRPEKRVANFHIKADRVVKILYQLQVIVLQKYHSRPQFRLAQGECVRNTQCSCKVFVSEIGYDAFCNIFVDAFTHHHCVVTVLSSVLCLVSKLCCAVRLS
jgi:hypothetical protein